MIICILIFYWCVTPGVANRLVLVSLATDGSVHTSVLGLQASLVKMLLLMMMVVGVTCTVLSHVQIFRGNKFIGQILPLEVRTRKATRAATSDVSSTPAYGPYSSSPSDAGVAAVRSEESYLLALLDKQHERHWTEAPNDRELPEKDESDGDITGSESQRHAAHQPRKMSTKMMVRLAGEYGRG